MTGTVRKVRHTIVLLCAAAALASAAWGISPADRCQAAKLKLAGSYALCRLKADARAVRTGDPIDYSRCDNTFATKWSKTETAADGACPTNSDAADIQEQVVADTDLLALRLTGARFVDNGDGTVTDTQTRLMWEKKNDAGGLHDVDNTYTWTDAMTVFVAATNGLSGDGSVQMGLAGHNDWRLPSNAELQTLLIAPYPCATNPCIDPIFGTAAPNLYWSSTRDTTHPTFSWGVFFNTGLIENDDWSKDYPVRAVRGGS
jgi:hypothetical protein